MSKSIRREMEEQIIRELEAVVLDHVFVPYTGLTEDDEDLEPPYTVVYVATAEDMMMTDEQTFYCEGNIQLITQRTEVAPEAHATLANSIYAAAKGITKFTAGTTFVLHGFDTSSMRSAESAALGVHSDIIDFTAGATRRVL